MPRRGAFALAFALVAAVCFGTPAIARAQAGAAAAEATPAGAVELEVKAAYVYKFANYVDWPPEAFHDAAQPIVIGVLGADALADELQGLVQGKTVKGRGFLVRRVQTGDDLRDVHILFLGDADRAAAAALLATVDGRHVLTVSDSKRVFAGGSMVNLVTVKQRVRFEVALPPVQRSRLRMSALMLTAAYRVQKEAP